MHRRTRSSLVMMGALVTSTAITISACAPLATPPLGARAGTPAVSASPTSPSPEASPETITRIVALGDSVPRGTHCNCTPYPELTAQRLGIVESEKVTITNKSVAGLRTTGVARQLERDSSVKSAVRAATIIEIEIGANDVSYSGTCGTNYNCYATKFAGIKARLADIVAKARALNPTEAHLVLLDYWSAWLGGKYARAKGHTYVVTAARVTNTLNAIIRDQAARSHAIYVDLRAAFKGPNYSYDETHYLAPDGDHPNAAGHRRIATAAVIAIRARWNI